MGMPETWPVEKRLFELQFYSVLSRKTRIIDIDPREEELGYTSSDGDIHLAYEHPIMQDLTEQYGMVFRYGVFTHETLHQVFTSFSHLHEVLDRHRDEQEKKVISLYANLVEDPSIEFFAPQVFGGEMLKALQFSIRHIYDTSPELAESDSAYSQFISALIMFGDMGLLKGTFTFPEAEKYFRQIAPEFNATVINPDPKARIDAAERWMVLTRPLWQKEAEDKEKFEQMLKQMLDELLDGGMEGNGDGETAEGSPTDERSERRDAFAKALEEESEEKPEEKPEEKSDSVSSSETDDTHGNTEGSGSDENSSENGGEDGAESSGGKKKKNDSENESTDSSVPGKQDKESADANGESAQGGNDGEPASALDAFRDDGSMQPMQLSDEMIDEISGHIQRELRAIADESTDTLDLPVEIPRAKGSNRSVDVSCTNISVTPKSTDCAKYKALVQKLGSDIRLLTNGIRQLLRADYDDYLRATSGRYSLKRDLDHTTVKVFDKKRERKNIDDMAVMLLIDCSGSMHGNKITLAKETAVMLAETFAALKIPCYIMGFTADTADTQVVHLHYLSWKNTPEERMALMQIQAYANNDDGYSIRYATNLMKRRQAEHKLLFVISDGAPACGRYRNTDGIQDTANAIREAKKTTDIFGIGIGMSRYDELKAMYKGNYINVRDTSQLSQQLAKQLKRVIRTWLN